jgi:hypothetical protein
MTTPPPETTVPWAPEDLPVHADELAERWSYIVLEEIVDAIALLRRWSWPFVDQNGRLAWPSEAEHDQSAATIDVAIVRRQLYEPNGLEREPRIGDVFAAEERAEDDAAHWHGNHVADLRTILHGSVYDISADAREAAKIAYVAGLASIARVGTIDDHDRVAVNLTLAARADVPLVRLEIASPEAFPFAGPA